jgi:dTDP-4-amino-4,6-dideoxygalactose transaminase
VVRFLDLASIHAGISRELEVVLGEVLVSGQYILGPQLVAFEAELAAHEGVAHAVGVGNGLDAIALTLRALGIGPGDEVIVPSNTFVATWLAVSLIGAMPIPVEPVVGTSSMDPDALESAINTRTAAIVPVHLYGQPVEVDRIASIAARHDLPVVFDGAQSIGAKYAGRPVAAFGQATTLSFYPGKNLGALGDGGAVLTDDAALADRVRLLPNYGSRVKYQHEIAGQNSRLDEMQAAVLRVKLRHLDAWTNRRREVADRYCRGLASAGVVLPQVVPAADPVWHLYVVRTEERDGLAGHLGGLGIETLVHYPVPPHRQNAYSDRRLTLPIADGLAGTVLSLPMGPHLSDSDIEDVVAAVHSFHRRPAG